MVDVIIPAYNEEGNIEVIYKELSNTLKDLKYTLIFIDDGSTDKTYDHLVDLYDKDKKHIKVIRFSRNFGKDAAIYAGLNHVKAEYTCIIDSDMQQNPKYILDMLKFLEKNTEYDQVAMVNDYKEASKFQRLAKTSFYRLLNRLSDQKFVTGASDFRVLRKYVVKAILEMKESNRFTKGLFSWVGFNTYYMTYKVDKRHSGESKFKFRKQISYGIDGILSFSTKPLKIATLIGSIISLIAFIYLIQIIGETLLFGKEAPGYASMMCVILMLGGIEILVLGIIGEYIAKSYIETKNRPIYLEKNSLGFDDDIL